MAMELAVSNSVHNNMFAHLEDRSDVYRKLLADGEADRSIEKFSGLVGIVALGFGLFRLLDDQMAAFALLIGIMALIQQSRMFIDASNRNWAMHVIDWIEDRAIDAEN